MKLSVVLSTYQSPALLERTLHGYRRQRLRPLEIVIADDGSGPETAALLARLASELSMDLRHVWHEDRGFRKCAILNRAIAEARGDYLVFSDGDCIPWAGFLETHAALARPGFFLSGGYFRLPRETTERLTVEDVADGRHEDIAWLHRHGLERSWRARRLAAQRRAHARSRPAHADPGDLERAQRVGLEGRPGGGQRLRRAHGLRRRGPRAG